MTRIESDFGTPVDGDEPIRGETISVMPPLIQGLPEEDLAAEPAPPFELPPEVQVVPDMSGLTDSRCRFCSQTFPLLKGHRAARTRHEKQEHPEEWEKANKKKLGSAGARAGAPSSSRGRSTRPTSATRSMGAGNRLPASQLLSTLAQGASWALGRASVKEGREFLGPVARMVGFEAPIIGTEGDKAVAGTLIDRLAIQKMLGAQDRFEAIGPLIGAPVIVGLIGMRPEAAPELVPFLRWCLVPMLPALIAEMERQKTQAETLRDQAAQLAEMDPAFAKLFAEGGDPIDAIIAALFPTDEPEPADAPS